MDKAERTLKEGEPPAWFLSFLVPYFYGVTLSARDRRDAGLPYIARAVDIVTRCQLKARLDMLVRGQDRFVQVLRAWSIRATK